MLKPQLYLDPKSAAPFKISFPHRPFFLGGGGGGGGAGKGHGVITLSIQ